jgi:hypothetical protein
MKTEKYSTAKCCCPRVHWCDILSCIWTRKDLCFLVLTVATPQQILCNLPMVIKDHFLQHLHVSHGLKVNMGIVKVHFAMFSCRSLNGGSAECHVPSCGGRCLEQATWAHVDTTCRACVVGIGRPTGKRCRREFQVNDIQWKTSNGKGTVN